MPKNRTHMQTEARALHTFFLYIFFSPMYFPFLCPFLLCSQPTNQGSSTGYITLAEAGKSSQSHNDLKVLFIKSKRLDTNESHFFITQTPFHSFIHSITAMPRIMICWHTVQVLLYEQEKAQRFSMKQI